MDRQTLRQILFQGKQIEKRNKSLHNKQSGNCLLGNLQLHHRHQIPDVPSLKKFQIVQLKKQKLRVPKKQINVFDKALKQEVRIRQLRTQRDNLKVDKIEHSQLGMFQKSLGIRFVQPPKYFLQGDAIRNTKPQYASTHRKSEFNSNIEHETSVLNIETLADKFIPQNIFGPKQYKKIINAERRKIINQKNQSIKKNIYIDLKVSNNQQNQKLLQKQIQKEDLLRFASTQLQLQQFRNSSAISDFGNSSATIMNRANSMNGSQRKNFLKRMFEQQKQFQQKIQHQKRVALQIRKQLTKNYSKPFSPPQNISAFAYIIYQITKKQCLYRKSFQNEKKKYLLNSHKILVQLNSRSPSEIASLTKIMTLIVVLETVQKFKIRDDIEKVRIGGFQQSIGTTAGLQKGQTYMLENLYYGLMLPSGNDASLALAVWAGKLFLQAAGLPEQFSDFNFNRKKRAYYEKFIQHMNLKAQSLGMQKTKYANSHGLMNADNKSCAFDLAILCEYAMKNEKFKAIVNTKRYQCVIGCDKESQQTAPSPTLSNISMGINIQNEDQLEMKNYFSNQKQQCLTQVNQIKQTQLIEEMTENEPSSPTLNTIKPFIKKIEWQNTHYLIHEKSHLYKGIKTGITTSAGPCLSSFIQSNNRQFIIIVLNCKNLKQRFRDTQALRKWTFEKQGIYD